MLLAVLIFVATIALVIWQPRGLGIGWSAMGGAAVALGGLRNGRDCGRSLFREADPACSTHLAAL